MKIGDKPSYAPMLTGQVTDDAYMRQLIWISMHQIMACRLVGVKSLVDPLMIYRQFQPQKYIKWNLINVTNWLKYIIIGEGHFWFQAMALCQTGDKPLPEPIPHFSGTYIASHDTE